MPQKISKKKEKRKKVPILFYAIATEGLQALIYIEVANGLAGNIWLSKYNQEIVQKHDQGPRCSVLISLQDIFQRDDVSMICGSIKVVHCYTSVIPSCINFSSESYPKM